MALKVKRFETPYGLTLENVYFRICMITYVDNAEVLKYKGVFYVNEDVRNEDKLKYITGEGMDFEGFIHLKEDVKALNLFEYCYNHIKSYAKEVEEKLKVAKEDEKQFINTRYLMFLEAEDC